MKLCGVRSGCGVASRGVGMAAGLTAIVLPGGRLAAPGRRFAVVGQEIIIEFLQAGRRRLIVPALEREDPGIHQPPGLSHALS